MNKYLPVILILLAAGALLYLIAVRSTGKQIAYDSEYGISFNYPAYYRIVERTPDAQSDWVKEVILIDTRVPEPPRDSEGPPVITMEVYRNDFSNRPLENWIRGSRASNFTQSIDGTLYKSEVSGQPAFFYRWDGLYRADTYALGRNDTVILLSVSYLIPDDGIHEDFEGLLRSVRFH